MSSIYKRRLKSGKVSWIADYVDPFTGKRRRESFAKQKYANERLDQVNYRRIRGEPIDTAKTLKVTTGELVDDFKKKCIEKEGKAAYNRNRRAAIDHFKRYFGVITPVSSIGFRHLEDLCDWLASEPTVRGERTPEAVQNGGKRTPGNVNRQMSQIKKMFRKGRERGLLLRNPFVDGRLKRQAERARDRVLTPEEFDRLMAEAAEHLRPIILTATMTGLRRGNLLALTWDQIDFRRRCISLDTTKNQKPLDVPIVDTLAAVLKVIRRRQKERHLELGRPGKQPESVFTFERYVDGRLTALPIRDIKTAFGKARQRAHLGDVRFHDLRHLFASCLRAAGVDMFLIGAILGHSNKIITQTYAEESWPMKMRAASHIERLTANAVGTYWHTPLNESNELAAKQALNACQ